MSSVSPRNAFMIAAIMILVSQSAFVFDSFDVSGLNNDSETTLNNEPGSFESGSSGNNLTASIDGANLSVDQAMTDITFQYNASGSGMQNGVPVGIMLGGGEYQLIEHTIDSNDKHHLISYNGRTSTGLYYTTNSGGSWTTTMLDSGAYGLGYGNDIEVDSNNNPHVVYEAGGAVGLNYTYLSNGVWSTPTTIDFDAKNNPKLVIDSNDNMHVVSVQRTNGGVANYTTNIGGSWVSESFYTGVNQKTPVRTDIALNSSGNVTIAFILQHGSNTPPKSLTVYDKNGSTWDSEQIEYSQSLGTNKVELQVDSYDVKHLYYGVGSTEMIRNDASGAWSSNLNTITYSALGDMKIEANGTMHILYKDGFSPYRFYYSTNISGTWVTKNIANSTNMVLPTHNALDLDSQGNLHYFFRDNSSFGNGTLYHLVENGVSTVGGGSSGSSGTSSGNGTVWQVADINSGSGTGIGSGAQIIVGDTIYFSATDGIDGTELWAHDTSNSSTWQVADINSGSASSIPTREILVGDTIYFDADDGSTGHELWAHDTSNSSTWQVADINSGAGSSNSGFYMKILVGDTIYFSADDGSTGTELWAHDTSNSSTWQVADIRSGSDSSNPGEWMEILVGDTIYFDADDGIDGRELWAHDTSNSSTWQVADIRDYAFGVTDSNPGSIMVILVGDTIYISADDGGDGYELWAHDTSNSSTWQVADINSASSSNPGQFMEILVGDTIYFSADDGSTGAELWAHDTSNSSTWQVADIRSGSDSSNLGQYMKPILVGDTIYFSADDGSDGVELWAHDTSNSSTWQVADIWSGAGSSNSGFYMNQILGGDTIYFDADDGSTGYELWAHDTSNSSTWQVADINSASNSHPGLNMKPKLVGDTIYFDANDGIDGTELWAVGVGSGGSSGSGGPSNGPVTSAICSVSPALPAGVSMAQGTCTISGTPNSITTNTTYTITANISNTDYSTTIWLSTTSSTFGIITSSVDGADLILGEAMGPITLSYTSQAGSGTTYNGNGTAWMVKDIYPGSSDGIPSNAEAAVINNTMFFGASTQWEGPELWKSDGTADGTVMVKDIISGQNGGGWDHATAVGTTLFGNSNDGIHGNELWKSDGTANGTVMVKDIKSGSWQDTSNPDEFVVFDNSLFFTADDGINGRELWKSDGTTNGTVMVKDIGDNSCTFCYGGLSYGTHYTVIGNTLFFHANDGFNGTELWKTDGTANGTVMVKDINPGSSSSYWSSTNFAVIGTTLFFGADDGTNGIELWKSDGTAIGTVMVKDIRNQVGSGQFANSGHPLSLEAVGNSLIFTADDGTNGRELWKTDGTATGTVMIKDINSGSGGAFVSSAVQFSQAVGNTIFFGIDSSFSSSTNDMDQFWKTDGTTSGTVMVKQIVGTSTTAIGGMNQYGTTLFFTANDGTNGTELWESDGTANGTVMTVNVGGSGITNSQFRTGMSGTYYFIGGGTAGKELWAYEPASITLNTPPPVSWETDPALPAGMSISNGIISGTPSVYANNQTYTVYANQSGNNTTIEMWFSVDSENPHTVVDGQAISAIGFHPPFWNGTTSWGIAPALPADLSMDTSTGEITGIMNQTLTNTTFAVTATHSGGATQAFSFNLESLADFDGDGLPNQLPGDYNTADPPTPGLIEDLDDDADGLSDLNETDTGTYVDESDTGTDPLDPDSDDDGICDGPNAVPPICIAGPDPSPNGMVPPPTLVGINNTAINDLTPYMSISGGTYEISPNLPAALSLDVNNGEITGTPTQTLANTTFTVWVNHTDGSSQSWDFTVEILEDTDGDGLPNELPGDYDSSNPDSPGLIEDLDDDDDGISDIDEENDGTDSLNPDTDGDGMCDGEIPSTYFDPNCVAGPDAFPTDPSGDTDTDGDGKPDTLNPPSNSVPPLEEDLDDDGDGIEDVNESNSGINNGPNDPGTDPLDPDTDDDGICDGPNDVYDKQGNLICIGGPDLTPLGEPASGVIYGLNNSQLSSLVPPYQLPDAAWEISPSLPQGLSIDPVNGIIGGIPTEITGNITYTIYGNSSTSTITFNFNLQILEDTDRDGEPNELPIDYPVDGSLIEDLDDDGDGASDLSETGTGIYNGTGDMGTDPLDPDTDDDGICDGPNDVLPQCIGGPDSNPFGTGPLGPTVLVNNTMTTPLLPANAVPGATWELSPQLPAGLTLDSTTGIITGTPTQTMDNTTFSMWANTTDPSMSIFSTFWLEVLEDTDGDGMPDTLPEDYPEINPPYDLIEDLDDDNDGMSDEDEDLIGTDPVDPDTDGDGFCDGNGTGGGNCYAGPDSHPLDPLLPVNTDGDGFPDDDPDGEGGLIADDDDDNDGFLDTREMECESDPLNATDIPQDLDGDGICDAMDDDIDGDGLFNLIENDSGIYNSSIDTGTDPRNADTDGDGVCDGPASPVTSNCTVGPDAFPLDPAAHTDTDGDGFPDELFGNSTSTPPLILDLDDDNDAWSDLDEVACLTDSLDDTSIPADTDADGVCDALDDILDLPFNLTYPTQNLQLTVDQEMAPFLPNITGAGDVATWEISGELPEGLTFGWSPARDAVLDGSIRGTPVNAIETISFTIWANNSAHSQSYEISLTIVGLEEVIDDDGFPWWLCFLFLIAIIIILPLILRSKNDAEPENTTVSPEVVGTGLREDPFILTPVEGLEPGEIVLSEETITITNMSPELKVYIIDLNKSENGQRFLMVDEVISEEGVEMIVASEEGSMEFRMSFDDSADPSLAGGDYDSMLKVGRNSVYFKWNVTVEPDPDYVKEMDETIDDVDEDDEVQLDSEESEKDAKKAEEAEAKAAKKAEEAEAKAAKKAEEAEAKAAKKAEEAEAEAKAAKAEIKKAEASMTKEEKKAAGIERVKAKAAQIDFTAIGVATIDDRDDLQTIKGIGPFLEEKLNALGIYTFKQISKMSSELEDQVNIAIEFFPGRVKRDKWVDQCKAILNDD